MQLILKETLFRVFHPTALILVRYIIEPVQAIVNKTASKQFRLNGIAINAEKGSCDSLAEALEILANNHSSTYKYIQSSILAIISLKIAIPPPSAPLRLLLLSNYQLSLSPLEISKILVYQVTYRRYLKGKLFYGSSLNARAHFAALLMERRFNEKHSTKAEALAQYLMRLAKLWYDATRNVPCKKFDEILWKHFALLLKRTREPSLYGIEVSSFSSSVEGLNRNCSNSCVIAGRVESLVGRAERTFRGAEIGATIHATLGAADSHKIRIEIAEASLAVAKLKNNELPRPRELIALELAIRLRHPMPFTRKGKLEGMNAAITLERDIEVWQRFCERVNPLLYSIGRVEKADGTPCGTGFLVSQRVIVTNRHVLFCLTQGLGNLSQVQARIAFGGETELSDPVDQYSEIAGIIGVHPTIDIALLAIAEPGDRPAIPILESSTSIGESLVTIGYPERDTSRNPRPLEKVMGERFGLKRAALGEVMEGSCASIIFHDCTISGGNSGSPIFSLKSGNLVGMLVASHYMLQNEGIATKELKEFLEASGVRNGAGKST